MKRLGIDIDGTVTCPSSILPFMNRDFNIQVTLDDVKEYDLLHLVDVSREEFTQWFKGAEPEIYAGSPMAEGAKEVLSKWKEQYELYFISARASHLLNVTQEWFTLNELEYHHIELIGTHNKIETAKKYKVELFLEDKHDNAVAIHEECGIPVILFDTPYNRDPIPEGVIRVATWQEADRWIRNWNKSKI
ncbi:nucleotidase [Bacillus sp. FJAT-18017]|uniref:5' nucleotidase, NT5C type n=1 Tax=Bacillus sp. FJAT-18017 TaxID=1705566 RepID=UPI0006AE1F84|nr:nucleotidase [Bacillus sp. FJAT-18017]ALC89921.1 nucleotidase [Bacillus sp. FJAT-18017]